ncbi:type II secretion system protein GspL [Roseibacterium beibuensis]|uniref:type II secretion system protein GspL n=1 Tax=[Roseibacterium] beibuensis TaxID=1193142 RepID=UPI00217EEC6E|nr:type II secretion system protein GspL [Roseibacterium beibuensis]MCS6627071.1 type II secretion system protein GspL [Roseibacterium beibuensis]
MKPTRLVLIPALAGEPAPWMIVAPDGAVLDRGLLTPHDGGRPEPMRTVAICPGADVSIRWLDLPPGGAAQLRAAAAWRLRDDLAATPDRVATVVGPPAGPDQPRLVAMVSHDLLQAWTDYLDTVGLPADVVTPDMLTLAEPDEDDVVQAVTFGENVALRGRGFAATVQPDLVDLVVGDRRVMAIENAAAVERALTRAALSPLVNLLDSGVRDRSIGRPGWRRAAGLAAALALSPLLLTAAAAARDDMAARRLEVETVEAIAAVAPDLARESDPVAALRRRAAAAPPPGGVTASAAALFTAVEAIEGVEIDAFLAAPDDGVRATLSHPGWSDMQELDRRMADAGMAVTENATLEDGGRVVSDISIGARP